MSGVRGLGGVDLGEADDGVKTGGERTVPDDIVGGGMHDAWFEGRDGSITKSCGYGVSESREK